MPTFQFSQSPSLQLVWGLVNQAGGVAKTTIFPDDRVPKRDGDEAKIQEINNQIQFPDDRVPMRDGDSAVVTGILAEFGR